MLVPVNRYVVVEYPPTETKEEQLIVLPDDYTAAAEKFIEVVSVRSASDVRFDISHPSRLVVDRSMIEEISVAGTIYNVILDNYILGVME
jgi:co-chaperonin GroES (HSP10)